MKGMIMKKIISAFVLAGLLISSTLLFAADGRKNGSPGAQAPKKTFFNRASEFFSTFDRPFTRPGNKQNFWNATSDWLKNIDKY